MTGASFMVLFAAQSPTLLNILSRSSRWNLEVAALGDCGGLAEMSQLECRYYQGGKVDCVCVCTPRQWEMAGEYFPGAVRVWVLHNGHSHLIPEAIEPVHCLAFSKKVASFHRGVRPSLEVSIVVPYYIPKRIWKWRRQTVWCMQNRPQTRTGEIQRKIDAIRARTQGVDPTVYGQGQPAGFLDSNARLELMRECSCYLAPLYRKAGFGLAHHECFAAGVPVVTTTWGDMDEEMPGEYLTMSDDLEVLSVGLETLAMDEVEGPKLGNRLSEQGLQLIAQYRSQERMDEGIEEFMERIKQVAPSPPRTTGANRKWSHSVPKSAVPTSPPGRLPLRWEVCTEYHFYLDMYPYWADQIREKAQFHRKQWELVYILQALSERGKIAEGRTGLGFGVGMDPLTSCFCKWGCRITATDLDIESAANLGRAKDNRLRAANFPELNARGICPADKFLNLAEFREVDMNQLPDGLLNYDFCWSVCAVEHLGSIDAGSEFVLNAMETLAPGGVAVHTTEFNMSSDRATVDYENTVLFGMCNLKHIASQAREAGYEIQPLVLQSGYDADQIIDEPPFSDEPHLRIRVGECIRTSVGLIIEKPENWSKLPT